MATTIIISIIIITIGIIDTVAMKITQIASKPCDRVTHPNE